MKEGSGKRKGNLFYSWFFSYIVVLFVSVLISLFVYIQASTLVETEMNRANEALLVQVKSTLDGLLDNLFRMGLWVSENKRLQSVAFYQKPLADHQYYAIFQLTGDIELQRFSSLPFSGFYVYIKSLNSVISQDGYRNAEMQYEAIHEGGELSYQDWMASMCAFHRREFASFQRSNTKGDMIDTVAYLQTIPDSSTLDPPATLVILLDKATLLPPIGHSRLVEKGSASILDGQNRVITSNSQLQIPQAVINRIGIDHQGTFDVEVEGHPCRTFYFRSDVNDWKYVSLIPKQVYAQNAIELQRISILALLACILIGLVVSYIQSLHRYAPVRTILGLMSRRLSLMAVKRRRNEMQLLHEGVSKTLRDIESMGERLRIQNLTVNAYALARSMKGHSPLPESLQTELLTPEDRNKAILLYVFLFSTEVVESLLVEDLPATAMSFMPIITKLVLGRMKGQRGIMTEVDGSVACLLLFPRKDDAESSALDFASGCVSILKTQYHIEVTCGVGGPAESFDEIHRLYNQAMRAAAYKLVMGTGRVITYRDILSPKRIFSYPLEAEQRLIVCVKAGDLDTALKTLSDIYNANFNDAMISIEMAMCLVFDLVSTMIKAFHEIDGRVDGTVWEEISPVRRLLGCETADQIRVEMKAILTEVCQAVNRKKKSHNIALREQICSHIEAHLADPNLCTAGIADDFGMSTAYVARFFKEQTGIGVGAFITKLRVEQAKQLLRGPQISLENMAVALGFASSAALIRAFKRHEGITPGRYRELLHVADGSPTA